MLAQLGTDDPRAIVRTGEAVYQELGLAGADRDALLDAMVAHPILIERPIVIRGDRAVVGRPRRTSSTCSDPPGPESNAVHGSISAATQIVLVKG